MQGVSDPATENKGKGKAPEDNTMEESMDDDSSDESGVEEQVCSLRTARLPGAIANLIAIGRRRYTSPTTRA